MDGLHHRHKRSFTEMSQPDTLSPSPHNFGDSPASNIIPPPRLRPAPSNDRYNFHEYFERRRTPHPHNNYNIGSQEMSDRANSLSQPRPRLEHRASQTIIDLTDDTEEETVPQRPERTGRAQLRRSDAVSLGRFIDLTDDNDDDVIITGERQNPAPRPAPLPPLPVIQQPPRLPSPGLFLPLDVDGAAHFIAAGRAGLGNFLANFPFFGGAGVARVQQAMPGAMDYAHVAFQPRKPEHVAPAPARDNFTRSPTEADEIVCPACNQELIHKKGGDELAAKKNGKTLSRKDREEHPFWAVKECGHVYCNSCFQGRTSSSNFPERPSSSGRSSKNTKKIMCTVEDCHTDVKAKDKWVGIFL